MNQMTNSHILYNPFDYYEPADRGRRGGAAGQHNGRARVLAGGTDLLVQMKIERIAPGAVISLRRISGLDRTRFDSRGGVGAPTAYRRTGHHSIIERAPAVRATYQALAEACANFSSTQVQTMGTIGGNLGNASPAADSAPSAAGVRRRARVGRAARGATAAAGRILRRAGHVSPGRRASSSPAWSCRGRDPARAARS